mgnify:FL=1
MSKSEDLLLSQMALIKLPAPEREHRFHPVRRWRFDFAWPGEKFSVEGEGITF